MAWQALKYKHSNGGMFQVHVFPLGDKRMHTIPMCWCGPKMTDDALFTHNALDPRIV